MNVLFVCAQNATLSIMAQAILNSVGRERFTAFSAGVRAAEGLNEYVTDFLVKHHVPVAGLYPKGLDALRRPDVPRMDFVIALCSAAMEEDFSYLPGEPFVAHWSIDDDDSTATADGTMSDDALRDAFYVLMRRIKIFTSLPQRKLTRTLLQHRARTLEAVHY